MSGCQRSSFEPISRHIVAFVLSLVGPLQRPTTVNFTGILAEAPVPLMSCQKAAAFIERSSESPVAAPNIRRGNRGLNALTRS